jgi:hypothetical protein
MHLSIQETQGARWIPGEVTRDACFNVFRMLLFSRTLTCKIDQTCPVMGPADAQAHRHWLHLPQQSSRRRRAPSHKPPDGSAGSRGPSVIPTLTCPRDL